MSHIYKLLNQMYNEIALIKHSGTPEQYWKPQLKAIQELEAKLNKLG